MPEPVEPVPIRIEPWADADAFLDLLRRNNAPEMTAHLGGPETEEQLINRHKRYLGVAESGTGRMFRIVLDPDGDTVGGVGYWDREWQGQMVYETGWSVFAEHQGQGIATEATRLLVARARSEGMRRYLYAFPPIDNVASNAICRKTGFSLTDVDEFEYPVGNYMRCNVWRLELADFGPQEERLLPRGDSGNR